MNTSRSGDFDALREGAQVIAAVSAAIDAHSLAGGRGGQHDFQPGGIEEFALDVVDDNAVEPGALKLEVIAEETREVVNHDDIERRGLRRARLDHALEFGAAVVGGRGSGFDIGFRKRVVA